MCFGPVAKGNVTLLRAPPSAIAGETELYGYVFFLDAPPSASAGDTDSVDLEGFFQEGFPPGFGVMLVALVLVGIIVFGAVSGTGFVVSGFHSAALRCRIAVLLLSFGFALSQAFWVMWLCPLCFQSFAALLFWQAAIRFCSSVFLPLLQERVACPERQLRTRSIRLDHVRSGQRQEVFRKRCVSQRQSLKV